MAVILSHQCVGNVQEMQPSSSWATLAQQTALRLELALPDWAEVNASKDLDYSGEDVARVLPFTLGGIFPGLPPNGVAAALQAIDVADEHVVGRPVGPSLALLPRDEWPEKVPMAAIQTATRQEWHSISAKLVELGLAAPIADEKIFVVGNAKVLAGAFGI
ncbi:unnamed protein product, partial [Prorocentrum cordatum]